MNAQKNPSRPGGPQQKLTRGASADTSQSADSREAHILCADGLNRALLKTGNPHPSHPHEAPRKANAAQTANPREAAYQALRAVGREGAYSNLVLKQSLGGLSNRDRALASALVYGVLSMRLRLDYILSQFCSLQKTKPAALELLRLGAYQIFCMDRIPQSAAVNETVRLSKKYAPALSGFINGVLRAACRGKNSVVYPEREEGVARSLSVAYSFPEWLVNKWCKAYGEECTEALLAASNRPAGTVIRANRLKIKPDELAKRLAKEEINLLSTPYENAFTVEGGLSLEDCEAYRDGLFTVIQTASMAACEALEVKPGMRVLDMCAAPGGKTIYVAELMEDTGRLDAWDIHTHRVGLIEKNAARMGLSCIHTACRDAGEFDESLSGAYDAVLLDAPCSGLGVIRQKPDIKWKDPDGFAALSEIQKRLAAAAVRYVKPGGRLVYCTCTLNRVENEAVADNIEKSGMRRLTTRTLFPHIDETNGFFIAQFEK